MASGIVNLLVRFDFFNIIKYLRYYKQKSKLKGKGVIFTPDFDFKGTTFGQDIYIGKNAVLRHSKIDNNSYIGDNSKLVNTEIGKFCSIGRDIKVGLGKHPVDFVSTHPAFYSTDKPFKVFSDKNYVDEYDVVKIGHDVWIGENVIIPSGICVGNGAVIATGAIVTKDVEPYSIVGGVPARLIKYRFDKEDIEKLQSIEWWHWPESNYYKHLKSFHRITDFLKLSKANNSSND